MHKIILILLFIPLLAFSGLGQNAIYSNMNYVVLGNPNGKITVVDFSDYECGPCRSITRTLNYLAAHDSDIRIITIDYPMLGDDSVYAAKAAIASKYQGNYLQFHQALMNAPLPLKSETVLAVASQLGLSQSRLLHDMESKMVINELLNNLLLGNTLGIRGVPTFLVGYTRSPHNTTLFPGGDGEQLLQIVQHFKSKL